VIPFEPPKVQPKLPAQKLPMYVAVTVCVCVVLVGIGLSCLGLFKIFVTSPGMGIPVDAHGKRLPMQGYAQLWFGMAIAGIFSIFALITGACLFERRG
jgi:hypothetical protein